MHARLLRGKTVRYVAGTVAGVLLSIGVASAATVYQCKDEKGRVTLSDTPCGPTAASQSQKDYHGVTERDAAWRASGFEPAGPAMRKILCESHRDSYNRLDAQWLEAAKRRDDAAQKAVIERRRHLGAQMTKYGCG